MEPLLSGKRVLVTRSVRQSASMCDRIRAYGGEPVVVPLMQYSASPLSREEKNQWLSDVRSADWIVLTSQNSLKYLMSMLNDPKELSRAKIAVVGKKTEAFLHRYGLSVDFLPERFHAQSLLDAFQMGRIQARRIAVPLGSLADTKWIEALCKLGVKVTSKVLYETKANRAAQAPLEAAVTSGGLAAVTFASPSAVRFFTELLDDNVWRRSLHTYIVAVIGTVTAQALEAIGYPPNVVPRQFTASDMIDALADYYKKRKS
ncbi:uroporphyrinogen-III synthase [Sporolactobacillus sp. THM7-7]|nr:uroporphyrinogen-III synthase [Sporolactobacillus sp. THM7-7]